MTKKIQLDSRFYYEQENPCIVKSYERQLCGDGEILHVHSFLNAHITSQQGNKLVLGTEKEIG